MTKFLERLKQGMAEKNITAVDLSKETGIERVTISSYLNNEKYPSLEDVEKIAKAIGENPAWLLGWGGGKKVSLPVNLINTVIATVITLAWLAAVIFSLESSFCNIILATPIAIMMFFKLKNMDLKKKTTEFVKEIKKSE